MSAKKIYLIVGAVFFVAVFGLFLRLQMASAGGPPCGNLFSACCATGSACNSTLVCSGPTGEGGVFPPNTCEAPGTCGGLGQSCCGSACGSGLACNNVGGGNSECLPTSCGQAGQSCCVDVETGQASICYGSGLSCQVVGLGTACEPPQGGFSCNGMSCVPDPTGSYKSSTCDGACTSGGGSGGGTGASCGNTGRQCYSCQSGSCSPDSNGSWAVSNCNDSCSGGGGGAPYSYTLVPASTTCNVGDQVPFTAEFFEGQYDSNGNPIYNNVSNDPTNQSWTTDNGNASVGNPPFNGGVVNCGPTAGTVDLDATYYGPVDSNPTDGDTNWFASALITVKAVCTGSPAFVVYPATTTVAQGTTVYFHAFYYPEGTGCTESNDVTQNSAWASVNPSVVAYSGQFPTAAGAKFYTSTSTTGSAFITATYSGNSADAQVTVQPIPQPDFLLSATPTVDVSVGSSSAITVALSSMFGYSQPVSVYLEPNSTDVGAGYPLPDSLTAVSVPPTVTPTGNSTITVSAGGTAAVGIYTLYVVGSDGTITHNQSVTVNVVAAPPPPPTNTVNLSAFPTTATATVTSVNFTAVAGGIIPGNTVNYTFWWDCSYNGNDVAVASSTCGSPLNPAIGYKNDNDLSTVDSTSFTYPTAGLKHPIVIIESGAAAPASSGAAVTVVSAGGGGSPTHTECVNNACTPVAGAGVNRCSSDADCGGSGGGSATHGVCDAAQDACVNIAGGGPSTCSTDPACGGSGGGTTSITCEGSRCVIVDGVAPAGGCTAIGQSCGGGGSSIAITPTSTVTNESTPVSFTVTGQTGSCTWSSTGAATFTSKTATGATVFYTAPTAPGSPNKVTCTDGAGDVATALVTVLSPIPPTCSFTAKPSVIVPPAASTLIWSCQNAASCSISGVGPVFPPSGGGVSVAPTVTTQYTLSCAGFGGTNTTETTIVGVSNSGLIEKNP